MIKKLVLIMSWIQSSVVTEFSRQLYVVNSRIQGAYNSGKLFFGEFFNSGKLGENSGNFKFTQKIFRNEMVGIEFCA